MNRKLLSIQLLALAGVLFSGYLTMQWFRGLCAGGCSLLGGYPTCLYGLIMFSVLLIASLLMPRYAQAMQVVHWVAFAGVLFSLYFSVRELSVCLFCYPLGLPNCVYGLVVYATVWVLTWKA
jgi:uncharacterized membrane protein